MIWLIAIELIGILAFDLCIYEWINEKEHFFAFCAFKLGIEFKGEDGRYERGHPNIDNKGCSLVDANIPPK